MALVLAGEICAGGDRSHQDLGTPVARETRSRRRRPGGARPIVRLCVRLCAWRCAYRVSDRESSPAALTGSLGGVAAGLEVGCGLVPVDSTSGKGVRIAHTTNRFRSLLFGISSERR